MAELQRPSTSGEYPQAVSAVVEPPGRQWSTYLVAAALDPNARTVICRSVTILQEHGFSFIEIRYDDDDYAVKYMASHFNYTH